jgi:SRSO17 transposase
MSDDQSGVLGAPAGTNSEGPPPGLEPVGVARQSAGTAGRVEHAQVGVYLVSATDAGHAVVDRELDLPRSWTDDPDRLRRPVSLHRWGLRPSPSWPRP